MRPWWTWKWLDHVLHALAWLCVLGMVVCGLGLIVVWMLGVP